MKKILSLILCLAMLLSLGTLAISAEKIDGTTDKVLYANYGTVVMDGAKDDSMHINLYGGQNNGATMSSAMFGAVWNEDTLYIAMSGEVINSANHRGRALAFDRGYVLFENGASVEIDANGTVTGSEGVEVVKGESTSITQKDLYGNSNTREGVMYVEFAIPMEHLSFYDLGDGSLATQVQLVYVGGSTWVQPKVTLVLTDFAVKAGRDVTGSSSNMAAYNGSIDAKNNYKNYAMSATTFDVDNAVAQTGVGNKLNQVLVFKGVRTDAGVLEASKKTVLSVDLASSNLASTAGPVEAENWQLYSGSSATGQWRTEVDTNEANGSNPARIVVTTKLETTLNSGAALMAYAIYNVNGEARLYSWDATSANAPYVVLSGVNFAPLSAVHGNARDFFNLRLEIDENYNTVVKVNGRYAGTLVTPTATAYDNVPVKDWQPSELTVAAISDGTSDVEFNMKNPYVAQQSAAAVAALEALGNSFTVYGHQDTVKAVDGKYSVRFLAELPATLADYTALGYDIEIKNNNGTAKTTVELTRVYESVSNDQLAPDGLKAVVALRDIKTADGNCTITVKPWVVAAKGGEKLYGEAYSVTYTAAADGTLSFE